MSVTPKCTVCSKTGKTYLIYFAFFPTNSVTMSL